MTFLADLERLLERLFERSSARLFRTRIQVVHLERRVERAMEHARVGDGRRTTVPSRYRVRLAPRDLETVAAEAGGAAVLAGRLADTALAFARAHGYHLRARPSVALLADPSTSPGEIGVDAELDEGAAGAPPVVTPGGAAPVPGRLDVPAAPDAEGPVPAGTAGAPLADWVGGAPADLVPVEPSAAGIRGDGDRTLVFRRPPPPVARARLRVFPPEGDERTIEVDGSRLTIGRAPGNGLVLVDPRVSRHHGQLQARHGALVYTDLGSTNGTRVNGIRVDEIVLGAGDRLLVGGTVLVVETLPG